ncbi:alpha/beta hydrolase [Ramlibacter sp. AW1]|uniref:Alpha/beta hydrolase n=1 Tax=Ramlibacter aurantiacus TaxID=2801330 RepID=A0A936ZGX6_9BURK|nr:alpha/beta hydrolase [Ramlibacter aurantiacus]MBL0420717.1 alpha/beta hydrolase [Ramlibacter aurantiacus]
MSLSSDASCAELHPVVQRLLQAQQAAGRAALSSLPVPQARQLYDAAAAAFGPGPSVHATSERTMTVRSGERIALRVIQATPQPAQVVVYLHGGGWVLGDLDGFDALARALAVRSNSVVVLVDYRLAPEHPFPVPVHDAEDAVWHVAREIAPAFGADLPLVLAGDSAGANLAAVVCLGLRGRLPIAGQVLFNPVTDVDTETPSYREFAQGYTLTKPDMRWFFDLYAPGQWQQGDPRIAPLRTPDLRGAPPAWIGTAQFDVLRDEGERYAQRLRDAGVPVELRRFDGLVHGYARWFALVDAADRAVDDAARAIAAASATRDASTATSP